MFERLLNKFEDYRFEKRMAKQRYKRGFADCDCWGLNYWMCETFPQMILNLRDMKHGYPDLPFEEFDTLPEAWKTKELIKYKQIQKKLGYDYEPNSTFTKWYIILTRIAYCLKEANPDKELFNPYKEEFDKAFWGEDITKIKSFDEFIEKHTESTNVYKVLKTNEVNEDLRKNYLEAEKNNYMYQESMKNEALDLIKKYFYNMWD